jgi:hypothetical protein
MAILQLHAWPLFKPMLWFMYLHEKATVGVDVLLGAGAFSRHDDAKWGWGLGVTSCKLLVASYLYIKPAQPLLTGNLLLITSDLCITMAILQLQALPHLVDELVCFMYKHEKGTVEIAVFLGPVLLADMTMPSADSRQL